jgi:hypothetical protein
VKLILSEVYIFLEQVEEEEDDAEAVLEVHKLKKFSAQVQGIW